ncbi:MAG: DUF192 domain-containing protein [Candidatus Omnitrophota bacterium]|nr:DUF192 domain-containing protein [Candidatus Omnitrophota bacterium]
MTYKILNKTKGVVIVEKAGVAKTFFQRAAGLMFRENMDTNEAMIFYKAPSIHMFFMFFPIDVVFLDKNMRVMKICAALRPWQMASCFKSAVTIELPVHTANNTGLTVGDVLEFIPTRFPISL